MQFVLATQPRSGSHLLASGLWAHPEIADMAERFNPLCPDGCPRGQDPGTFLRDFLARRPQLTHGFIIHSEHYSCYPDLRPVVRGFADRVVFLRRMNRIERTCSLLKALKTGFWGKWGEAKPPKDWDTVQLTVAPERFIQELEKEEQNFLNELRFWTEANVPILFVTYEGAVADYAGTMHMIHKFIGVTPLDIKPGWDKQERRTPRELLTNYDEIAKACQGTRWATLFDKEITREDIAKECVDS